MNSGQYLKQVKGQIRETDVEAIRKVVEARQGKPGDGNGAGPVLIDVREKDEWTEGYIPGARWISRGFLELGYTNVTSMAGGFSAWKRAGLKFDRPFVMTPDQSLRYARHTMLPEVGEIGQAKLLQSKVLCLGAGGLGSPASLYLAAAGVGTVGFVDDDTVDSSNLQRQILHATDRVGMPKVESAKVAIAKLNPDVKVIGHQTRLDSSNVLDIIKDYDVIVDGADNFPTRYLINDAALKLGKPVIDGSIYRFEGTVTTFLPFDGKKKEGPCYRCLYPEPPPPDMAPSCQEAGVLGVLCGVIGALEATEAIKVLLGTGKTLSGRELRFDALGMKFREFKRPHDPTCPVCGDGKTPEQIELIDYHQFCNVRN